MTDPIAFPNSTARFEMPLLHVAQAQKEIFVNEALVRVDTLLQPIVEGIADEPQEGPASGECWIVSASPIGVFEDHANELACWQQEQWTFITPRPGMLVFDRNIGANRRFGDGWTSPAPIARPLGGANVDIEARSAINAILDCLGMAGAVPNT